MTWLAISFLNLSIECVGGRVKVDVEIGTGKVICPIGHGIGMSRSVGDLYFER